MKICFLTSNIFSLGGVQRVVSVLANSISNYHTVDILCTETNINIDRSMYNLKEDINIILDNSISTDTFNYKVKRKVVKSLNNYLKIYDNKYLYKYFIGGLYSKKFRNKLIKIINDEQYDVVIGVEGDYSLLLSYIADEINAKTIGWQHNSYDAYWNNKYKYYWNQNFIFEKMLPNLDKYIVLTNYDKDKLKKEKNIDSTVIYNPKSFKSLEKSNMEKMQFLAAGRFTEQKGFDLLIDSFNIFSKQNSTWKLVIVGEGKDKQKIKEKIKSYNLEERIVLEEFSNDIKQYFLNSSVLLLPSRWEGMPMIVLESFEMGVPIVSYNITAIQELMIDGHEGKIVDKYNVTKFADAMKLMSDNKDMRSNMSINAIERAKDFDVENITEEWLEIIKCICRRKDKC